MSAALRPSPFPNTTECSFGLPMEARSQNVKSQARGVVISPPPEPCPDLATVIGDCAAKGPDAAPGSRLVYLLSRFPAVSHTFFMNEVGELRKLGFTIEVASINPPDRPHS